MPILRNVKQERFCREYTINGMEIAGAARAVGISAYTANKWLDQPEVLIRIQELTNAILQDLTMSKEEMVAELCRIASFNPRDLYDEDGRLIPVSELARDTAVSVQEVEMINGVPVKIKAGRDKMKALETGLKYYNAFEDHQKAGSGEVHIHLDEKDSKL